jgi:Tol biopolymer transport system component
MNLTAGVRLGPYEILSAIGAGGMGEVYRARDTKLNRDVAIKILPELFATDPERLARFTREAQTLAALNHTNIAQIYGVIDHPAALVMEFADGEDLSAVIARGPLPVGEALAITRQIVEALEAAHEQGIVHRDLKPANIKVKTDGTVKVLDFGLAKAMDPLGVVGPDGPAYHAMNSPTFTAQHTQMGVILGTAAYMAPEQARGRTVDKRADIWAFGIVLFEMLTGRQTFGGDTISEVMAAVMKDDPEWNRLPPGLPPQVIRVLRRCLVKDPRQRLRDIGDARLLLDDTEVPPPSHVDARASGSGWLAPVAIVLSLVAIGAAVVVYLARPQPARPTTHLSIVLPDGEQVTTPPGISPDGRTIAYASGRTRETSHLYVRSLDSPVVKLVDGSLGGQLPFFSPDSRSLAFFAGGKLRRTAVSGGAPVTVADAARPWGGTWCGDGNIIYVPTLDAGLWRVSASGGPPKQLTKPDSAGAGYAHAYPQCLPGSTDVLFTFWGQTFFPAVYSLKSGTWRQVTPTRPAGGAAVIGIYAEAGYLLTGDNATGISAVEWNPTVTGTRSAETVVLDDVYHINGNERVWLNVSANGNAAYVPGSPFRRRLVWVDRHGNETAIPGEPDAINEMTISRDGRRIARRGYLSQWVEDLATGTRTRIISDMLTWQGGWLPGDDRLVVSSVKDGDWDLYTISASGGELKPLLKKPHTQHPLAVAPDGSVVYFENHPDTGADIWILTPDGKTRPLANTPFSESSAAVSADGRYVAYTSDESGHSEVYALPFSGSGDRVTVSIDGGTAPVWSRDGKELFYRGGDNLMSIDVLSTSPLKLGARKKLFDVSAYEPGYFHDFDVSPDGQRFLFIRAEPGTRPTHVEVILNWFPELQRLVQK